MPPDFMRSIPKPPDEQEIALRKKLRLTCEFFDTLNQTADLRDDANAGQDSNFLPPETVEPSRSIVATTK